jgi:hypothetical protein
LARGSEPTPTELGIISAKGRNGMAELLKIIANEQDGVPR